MDWDYFVAVAMIEGEPFPVLFTARTIDRDVRTQIHAIATKNEIDFAHDSGQQNNALGDSPNYGSSSISSDNLPQPAPSVNTGRSQRRENLTDRAVLEQVAREITSIESVENAPDLLAFHNTTTSLLNDVLDRNGFAMPSLAITNKGMTDFGEITVIFDKNTIDPASSKDNKLYGADAWTPTQTNLKLNAKFDTAATERVLSFIRETIGTESISLFDFTAKQFERAIAKADGSIYDAFAHNIGMQTAYAMSRDIAV